MNTNAQVPSSARPAFLWLVGGAALAVGLLVYWVDRPAASALLLPGLAGSHAPLWFGAAGGWLPSFVHALAFSLFTAAWLPPGPRQELGACAFWFAVNAAFEIGQHPQLRGPLAEVLQCSAGQGPIARSLANYFLRGTFDSADLFAAALGAALAAALLRRTRVARRNPHEP